MVRYHEHLCQLSTGDIEYTVNTDQHTVNTDQHTVNTEYTIFYIILRTKSNKNKKYNYAHATFIKYSIL